MYSRGFLISQPRVSSYRHHRRLLRVGARQVGLAATTREEQWDRATAGREE
jgi:hypothetical protein